MLPYSLRKEGRSAGAVGTAQAAVFRRRKPFRLFKTVGKVEAVLKANGIGNLFNGKVAFSQHFHSPVDTQITYIVIQGFSGRIFKQYAEIFGGQLKACRQAGHGQLFGIVFRDVFQSLLNPWVDHPGSRMCAVMGMEESNDFVEGALQIKLICRAWIEVIIVAAGKSPEKSRSGSVLQCTGMRKSCGQGRAL